MAYDNALKNGSLFTESREAVDINQSVVYVPSWVAATLARRGYTLSSGLKPEVMQTIFSLNDQALFIATGQLMNDVFYKLIEKFVNTNRCNGHWDWICPKNLDMVLDQSKESSAPLRTTLTAMARTEDVRTQAIERLAGKTIDYVLACDEVLTHSGVLMNQQFNGLKYDSQAQGIANQETELYSVVEIDRNTVGVIVSATTALALFGNKVSMVNKSDNTYVTTADHMFFILRAIMEKLYDRNGYGTLASSSFYGLYLELLRPSTGKFQV